MIKIDDYDREAWKAAAAKCGLNLSEWIRRRCNGDARAILPPGTIVPTDDPRNPSQGDFEAAVTNELRKSKKISKTCPHGKERGYNCGFCGGLAKVGE